MVSVRKLRRRLKVWQRYAARYRTGRNPTTHAVHWHPVRDPHGFVRADVALWREQVRRDTRNRYWPVDRHLDDWEI